MRSIITSLTPTIEAPGPHDFAVRKLARSSVAPPASIASQPYVRDDRETPLVWAGMARDMQVIWVKREWEYFQGALDDPNQIECKGEFSFTAQGLRQ